VQKGFQNKIFGIILLKRKVCTRLTAPWTASTSSVHGALVSIKPGPLASDGWLGLEVLKGTPGIKSEP
jgi:hypothetical protein